MKRNNYWVAFLLFIMSSVICDTVEAQMDAQFSAYMFNQQLQNPASVGEGDLANAFMNYRHQWQDLGPQTVGAYFDMPLKIGGKTHGAALSLINDKFGLFTTTHVNLSYAHKQRLWDGVFSVGAQVGFLNFIFDGGGVTMPTSPYHNSLPSPTFETESSGTKFDMNLGVYFSDDKQRYGLAITHLNRPILELNYAGTSTYYNRTIVAYAAHYFALPQIPDIRLETSALVKTDGKVSQLDLNANAWYKDLLFGGIGYRFQDAIVAMGGLRLENGILIGGSYDITSSKIAFNGFGTAEVFLNYKFSLSLESKKNKYKSIRIL